MFVKLLFAISFCFVICDAEDLSFPQLSDTELNLHKKSSIGYGVFLRHKKDLTEHFSNALSSVLTVTESLNSNGPAVGVLNCNESSDVICEDKEEKLLLFKDGEVVNSVDLDYISTPEDAEFLIVTLLNEDLMLNVTKSEDLHELVQTAAKNKKNIILAISNPGELLHQALLNAALESNGEPIFAYTMDFENPFFTADNGRIKNINGELWVIMCSLAHGEKCPYGQYKATITSNTVPALLRHMQQDSFATIINDNATLNNEIESGLDTGKDIVILTAGKGKLERALKISESLCSINFPFSKCLVVDGQTVQTPVATSEGRIYMSFKTQPDIEQEIMVGYLGSESFGEVEQHYERLNEHRLIYERSLKYRFPLSEERPPSKRKAISLTEINETNEPIVADDEESRFNEPVYVQEIQDDAVMHAVHTNKALKDLYLFDFKSYSRLTDVTYEKVITGSDFAVILFTHEFNPKALAALATFIEIHRTYAGNSPLHRVECFDWPDVCQKAEVTTYPRMFFYRSGNDRTPHEYKGIWMQSEIEAAIRRYSLAWPMVVQKESDLDKISATSEPIVCGIAFTEQGEKVFREAAQVIGGDYQVLLIKKSAVSSIKPMLNNRQWDGKSDLIAVNINTKFLPYKKTFSTVEDVKQIVAKALEKNWVELSVINFQKLMAAPEPLVIQYIDKSAVSRDQLELRQQLEKIANSEKFYGKILFTWMDSTPNTAGNYALHMHSGGEWEGAPIAFFNKKGSVNFKSVTDTKEDITSWLNSCLEGKEKISYKLRNEEWKGRLPGYDLLQIMKDEGTYPVFQPSKVTEEEQEKPKPTGGRFHGGKPTIHAAPAVVTNKPHTEL
uniref:Thioredoxin domain-containing protein n=1 Tax=Ciona savignyi TaxID=51511 RepID=H2ZFV1_CIOSA